MPRSIEICKTQPVQKVMSQKLRAIRMLPALIFPSSSSVVCAMLHHVSRVGHIKWVITLYYAKMYMFRESECLVKLVMDSVNTVNN